MAAFNPIGAGFGALVALHQAQRNSAKYAAALVPLATGSRINRGADDPAGLIASENLRASLASLDAETRALERNDLVAGAADAALSEISSLTTDLGAAAVAVANTGAMSDAEREAYQLEADSAAQTIGRIAQTARFNGERLFSGELDIPAGGGATGEGGYTIGSVSLSELGETELPPGVYSMADIMSGRAFSLSDGDPEGAQTIINAAGAEVAAMRGALGAFQRHTLGSQIAANETAYENTASANSGIRDTDYASATSEYARAGALYLASLTTLRATNAAGASVMNYLA